MIRDYYAMTKPGIVFGNAITAAAGFFLASKGGFDFFLFIVTLCGLSFIVASGCVLNNYFDRISDQRMNRTKSRPLAKGSVPLKNAIVFGVFLLLLGTLVLSVFTNWLATLIALIGFVVYVGFYTVWKYYTVYGTEIGSVAGAVPPVVGYSAITGQFDLAAAILFFIVALWQMPHFFAIAIYRRAEYASASIPVLPLKKGIYTTKLRMTWYLLAFIIALFSLTHFGYAGYRYLATTTALSLYWLWVCLQGFKAENDSRWARKVFFSSLLVITGVCGMIALDSMCG